MGPGPRIPHFFSYDKFLRNAGAWPHLYECGWFVRAEMLYTLMQEGLPGDTQQSLTTTLDAAISLYDLPTRRG